MKENLTGDDVREGLTAVVSVKVPQPQFEGQTKGKLNSDIAGYVAQFVNEKLGEFFDKNPTVVRKIVAQGDRRGARARSGPQGARPDAAQGRARFRRPARQTGRLPGARSGALRAVPGGGRIGRRHRQAGPRPPLSRPSCRCRGKILNVEKARYDKMLGHEEIRAMITALGTGIGKDDFDAAKLRYGKIIIMTDADVDGSHIRTLLLTFFFRHMHGADQARQRLHRAAAALSHQEGQEREVHQGREGIHQRDHAPRHREPEGGDPLRGNGDAETVLEGTELRTFLMNLDEYQQMFHKVERRLRDPRVVEVLARHRAAASTPRPISRKRPTSSRSSRR